MIKIDTAKDKISIGSLSRGLVAHYSLDMESLQSATTFADKTPNQNVGTKMGSVLKFDGSNDLVDLGTNASLDITENITLSAWVKFSSTQSEEFATFVGKWETGGNTRAYWLEYTLSTSDIRFYLSADGITFANNIGFIPSVFDKWIHIVGTYDGTTMRIYGDGIEQDTLETSITIYSAAAKETTIGGRKDTPDRVLNGSIGDTRIYSRALTPAEVLTMYQGGVVSPTGLVAHYKMGDKSGTVLTDETGVNNGTLTDFADTTAEWGNTHDSGWVTNDTPNVFALDRKGHFGKSLSFDGESDYVDGGNDSSLNITEAITVSTWVKANAFDNAYAAFVEKPFTSSTSPYYDFALTLHGTTDILKRTPRFRLGVDCISTEPLNLDTWHHIVSTYDRQYIRIYVDGILKNSVENTDAIAISGENLSIGRATYFPTRNFDGSIADVRIYNRALDPAEITMLYETYRPKLSAGSLEKGKVLDLPLNTTYYNPGTDVLTDRTPYMNNGANNGAEVGADSTTFVSANEDTIRIADDNSLDMVSTMSAFAWVKGAGQNGRAIIDKLDTGAAKRSFAIISTPTSTYQKMRVLVSADGEYLGGNAKDYVSSIDILDNSWHFVGFTFNAGTLKLYVDGAEDTDVTKASDDAITTIFTSDRDVMIGSFLNNNAPTSFFDGDISHAKIYNRVLSDEEILMMFERGRHA